MGRAGRMKAKGARGRAISDRICAALMSLLLPKMGGLVNRPDMLRLLRTACRAVAFKKNPAEKGVVFVLPAGVNGVKGSRHFISQEALQNLVREARGAPALESEPSMASVPIPRASPSQPTSPAVIAGPSTVECHEEVRLTDPARNFGSKKKPPTSGGGGAKRPRPGASGWRAPGGWAGIQCRCTFEHHLVEGVMQMTPTADCIRDTCWSPWCPRTLLPSANLLSRLRTQCHTLVSLIDELAAMGSPFPMP